MLTMNQALVSKLFEDDGMIDDGDGDWRDSNWRDNLDEIAHGTGDIF